MNIDDKPIKFETAPGKLGGQFKKFVYSHINKIIQFLLLLFFLLQIVK